MAAFCAALIAVRKQRCTRREHVHALTADLHALRAGCQHRADHEGRADHELVVDAPGRRVVRELEGQRPRHRAALGGRLYLVGCMGYYLYSATKDAELALLAWVAACRKRL